MNDGADPAKTRTPKRSTVGVLIDSVNGYFNQRNIGDLIEAAEENDLHLVFYFGGFLEKDKNCGASSYAYTLPDPDLIDALIVYPQNISPFDPNAITRAILDQYQKIPVYSILHDLPDKFSVTVNEADAIEDMVRHLVEKHAYRKIAFLCGPDSPHSISRARQDRVTEILGGYGIDIPANMVFAGDFTTESGMKAAQTILSGSDTVPEALICANDQMAIGAVKEFLNNGISVPEEIAVVGFDDVEENNALPQSFSSINFPIWEMVTSIMERIANDLSGKSPYTAEKVQFNARFMRRESCGCTSWYAQADRKSGAFAPIEEIRESHASLKRMSELRRNLEETIEECIATNDSAPFNAFFKKAIRDLSRSGDLTTSFIDLFSTQWTITALKHREFNAQILVNTIFIDAFRLFVQTKIKTFAGIHTNDLGNITFSQNCSALISQHLSVQETIQTIAANLSLLGIERCLMVFLSPEDPDIGELRLSYTEGKPPEISQDIFPRFPARKLVHNDITSYRMPLAVLPLVQTNTVYGFLIFSMTNHRYEHFWRVQSLVSQIIDMAMANDLIVNRIKVLTRTNDALSRLSVIDEFTGLYNRRALYVTGRIMYQQACDNRDSCCFIFLDMDGLKKINDSFGHKDGDAAILALSKILKKSFREKDLVVRYGGDEFVILMANIHEKAVLGALTRISGQLAAFNARKSHPWVLSASWGTVFVEPSDNPKTFESIIEESDAKLYEEKRKKKVAENGGTL